MALFNLEELAEISEQIRLVFLGLTTDLFGKDISTIDDDTYQALVELGYVSEEEVNYFKEAFEAGWLIAHEEGQGNQVELPTLASVEVAQGQADDLPELSDPQQRALSYIEHHAATSIKGLGNRMGDDFSTLAIETENETRLLLESQIRDAIEQSVLNKETAQRLATRLGDATQDYARDLKRIAVFELESALQHGWAEHFKAKDPGAMVAKRVAPDACSYCKKLLEESPGIPKIFPLAELEANGTNVGRRKPDWLPVLGPMHPFCHCQLIKVPNGFAFNDTGQLVPASMIKAQDTYTVPQAVRNAAKRGLELRRKQSKGQKAGLDTREAGRQGIGSGVARARDLMGGTVSKETIKRMHAYFSRHASNYKLDPGKKPHEDKGYQAGLLWGGEAGRSFAARMVEKFNKQDDDVEKSTEVLVV